MPKNKHQKENKTFEKDTRNVPKSIKNKQRKEWQKNEMTSAKKKANIYSNKKMRNSKNIQMDHKIVKISSKVPIAKKKKQKKEWHKKGITNAKKRERIHSNKKTRNSKKIQMDRKMVKMSSKYIKKSRRTEFSMNTK